MRTRLRTPFRKGLKTFTEWRLGQIILDMHLQLGEKNRVKEFGSRESNENTLSLQVVLLLADPIYPENHSLETDDSTKRGLDELSVPHQSHSSKEAF